ncbi:CitMHS family transporter [Streptococcus rifensis]
MQLALIGFLMLITIIFLLFKGKVTPMVVFITVPTIAAFLAGFNIEEVVAFIESGIGTVSNMAILFIFSVTFFGVLADTGMFDAVVNRLVKKSQDHIVLVAVVTAIVAVFSHLDGATVTTVLITVPALLPLYQKLNIRPQLLILITACGMGVMNLLPWGGPVARAAAVLEMEANDLWQLLIPIQILGVFMTIGLAIIMILREKKHYQTQQDVLVANDSPKEQTETSENPLHRPKLIWFNFLLTLVVLLVLLWDKFPAYFVFMWGCALALMVNYPNVKDQKERIKAHAAAALDVSAVMLAAGIMVGILGQSGMLEAMAIPLLKIIPPFLARHLDLIMGVLGFPLGTMLGTDSYFYGLMPLAIEIGENYSIAPLTMGTAMLITKNLSLLISPMVPATYLATALAGVELKEHIRYSFIPLWIVGILMLIFSLLIGVIA